MKESLYLCVESTSKRGNNMANKSYASSELGGEESRYGGDPEYSKDFNSAYQKVELIVLIYCLAR